MKRLLLDTNIYGELIFDVDFARTKENLSQRCVIHGFSIIRNELRDVPADTKLFGKNLRIGLLHIYDELTKKAYPLTDEILRFADSYYQTYRSLGGSKAFPSIKNDFCIVACATLHQIDIVVSEDNKTMLTENALKAYEIVNTLHQQKTPRFLGYLKFKRWLLE